MDPSRAARLGRSFEFEGLGILVTVVETLLRDKGVVQGRGHEPEFEGETVVRMAKEVLKTIICLDLPCSLTHVKFSCVEKNNIAIQIEVARQKGGAFRFDGQGRRPRDSHRLHYCISLLHCLVFQS
ncbi:unnamed protein product [Musa acuminata var. zebrina]